MAYIKSLIQITLLLAVSLHTVECDQKERPRRFFWDLGYMIRKIAGLSWWELIKLNFHGNHCGWGGGGDAENDLDRCCEVHDKCYDTWHEDCGHFSFWGYKYSCPWHGECKCTETESCRSEACICDLDFAWCVKRHVQHLRG